MSDSRGLRPPADVLVTGHRGKLGRPLVERLAHLGFQVRGFDLMDGQDLRNLDALATAAEGCAAFVHLAFSATPDGPEQGYEDDLRAMQHVLAVAREQTAHRVVYASSLNAMGLFKGEAQPDYLPFDEQHPCRPVNPYSRSKLDCEALCEAFTIQSGIPTVCLRPPIVWTNEEIRLERRLRLLRRAREWRQFWEYGAYLHLSDAIDAFEAALTAPLTGHHRLIVAADQVASAASARWLATRLAPTVPWRGGAEYLADPRRALVGSSQARKVLGWTARHRWQPSFVERVRVRVPGLREVIVK